MERRIPFEELQSTLLAAIRKLDFAEETAQMCARLFAETTRDGVYSHGVNRFPRFREMIRNGVLDVHAKAEKTGGAGAFERWTGNRAAGNVTAHACMARAIELAKAHGMGCVALRDTTHWMRAGTYGWQAAEAGVIGMCWTNTMPNLVPWGGTERGVGNNPIVMAVPRAHGAHVVLDMAVSQYSFGAIAGYIARGEQLPFDGGYDAAGQITRDPKAIEATQSGLPIGYWKGSGLSVLLDMTAAMLSAGRATHQLADDPMKEAGQSQVFLAFDVACFRVEAGGDAAGAESIADGVVEALHAVKGRDGRRPRYPGEETLRLRGENMRLGVPVVEARWKELLELAAG